MKREVTIDTYAVSEDDVFLTVDIGDAQLGGSSVFANGEPKGKGIISNINLGSGNELRGGIVVVKTVVADVNDMTNNTSVTYVFTGGLSPKTKPAFSQVDNDGDSMIFSATFRMI